MTNGTPLDFSGPNADWHMHTRWSDGQDDIEPMLRAAEFQGMRCVAVTDHLWAETFPNGGCLAEYIDAVARASANFPGLEVHCGVEGTLLDIDGTLSVSESALRALRPVLIDFGGMTRGIAINAPASRAGVLRNIASAFAALCRRKEVDIVAHPFNFGRLIEGFRFDWLSDAFIEEIAGYFVAGNKYFEVMNNIWWWFPELSPEEFIRHYVRILRIFAAAGVPFSVGSDAHHHQGAGNLVFSRYLLDRLKSARL